jgi:hypothetical protein
MKKKIKILKDRPGNGSYTFLNEEDAISPRPYDIFQENNKFKKADKEKLEEIRKRKKAADKEGTAKSPKGLKFSNPSQRNHSSVYE